jgi:hypothetical protein
MNAKMTFGEWLPDLPATDVGANLTIATDVYPVSGGYRPFRQMADVLGAGSLDATCCGAASGRRRSDGTPYTAAASASKLYVTTSAGVLSDHTPGTWSLSSTSTCRFAQYGDRLFASVPEYGIQVHLLSGTSAFATLSADCPSARYLAVIGEHLVAGSIVGRGVNAGAIGTARDAVQWCFFRNPTLWPAVGTDAAKAGLSDYRVLPGFGGEVTGLVGGREYGIVFQQRQVSLAVLDPGGAYFRFTPIDDKNGVYIPGSLVSSGSTHVYYSESGWMRMDGPNAPQPIGFGRLDEWFRADMQWSYVHRVSACAHPSLPLVAISYPGVGSPSGIANRILIYNTTLNRWSVVKGLTLEWLVDATIVGSNVDTPISSDIDGSPFDVDAAGGTGFPQLAGFASPTHTLQAFTGSDLLGNLMTGDIEIEPGKTAYVRAVRPVYTGGGSILVRIFGRSTPRDTATMRAQALPSAVDGRAGVRSRARYHRLEIYTLSNAGIVSGFDVEFERAGAR